MFGDIPKLDSATSTSIDEIMMSYQGVVVCVSGGLDSTALLRTLCRIAEQEKKMRLRALHMAYGLRGEESAGDLQFVTDLCASLNVALQVVTVAAAERPPRGIQAWARRLRLEALRPWIEAGWAVALGHHLDDQAETALFRLARGAAPGGLAAMSIWRPPYWRPFLGTPKSELRCYLHGLGQSYREDSSNQSLTYSRNVIRHQVLPALDALFPGVVSRIVAFAEDARDLAESASPLAGPEQRPKGSQGWTRGEWRGVIAERAALPPGHQLSRGLLDAAAAAWQRGHGRVELPGGHGALVAQAGEIRKVPSVISDLATGVRRRQHPESHAGGPRQMLLESGAYATFTKGRRHWYWRRDHQEEGASFSLTLELARPPSTASVRFSAASRSYRLKKLLSSWGIDGLRRLQVEVVKVNGQTVGLTDGVGLYCPGPGGRQWQCSQVGFDLRYLNDKTISDGS